MTKVAVWCRHQGDNIIGIGPKIPWHVSSDFRRFKRLTKGQNVVAGEKTYESFPGRTLPERKIYVLTFNGEYEVSDKDNHFVVTDIKKFKEFPEDVYISGGAGVYKSFMSGGDKLLPDIIVDSVYLGSLADETGDKIDICACVEVMEKKYRRMTEEHLLDNVATSVWVKKGDFVEQSVLKRIIQAIEEE